MPTLTIGDRKVTVDDSFLAMPPDQQSAAVEEIASSLGTGPSKSEIAADVGKSAGIGVAKGGIGLFGIFGDARDLASRATDAVAGKLGASPETVQSIKDTAQKGAMAVPGMQAFATGPTSQDIQSYIESNTGKFYEPKTKAGQIAHTVGEFAPAALTGGGGILRRGAQVVIPALSSEAAGYATEGTAAEPYARAGAAILGASAAGALPRKVPSPTTAELFKSADDLYKSPEVKNLRIDPAGPGRVADDAIRAAESAGTRPYNAPAVYSAVDELRNLPGTTTAGAMKSAGLSPNATIDDIKGVRTVLNETQQAGTDALTGKMDTAAKGARTAKQKITDYLANIPAGDVVSGDAVAAGKALTSATGDYAAAMRSKTVDALLKRAEANAGSANSGANVNNANRQQLKRLMLNEKQNAGLSGEEMAQLERAVLGTKTGNAARWLGNALGPSGAMALQNSAAAGALGAGAGYLSDKDPATSAIVAAIASQLVGRGARMVGNASTARQAGLFKEMVGQRSPLHAERVANAPMLNLPDATRAALINAMLQRLPAYSTEARVPAQ